MKDIKLERKYDGYDSIGQRVRFWKSLENHVVRGLVYIKIEADIYKKDNHDYVGQVTFLFETSNSSDSVVLTRDSLVKMVLPRIETAELSPGETVCVPLSVSDDLKKITTTIPYNDHFSMDEHKDKNKKDWAYKLTSDPSPYSPSAQGILLGLLIGVPLNIVLIFIFPLEIALLISSPIVVSLFFYGAITNMNKDHNFWVELVKGHFLGLIIGVPTWYEIFIFCWIFEQI